VSIHRSSVFIISSRAHLRESARAPPHSLSTYFDADPLRYYISDRYCDLIPCTLNSGSYTTINVISIPQTIMSDSRVPCSAPYVATAASYENEYVTLQVGLQDAYGEFLVSVALLRESAGYFSEW
jgi:hypothetical protein